MLLKERLRAARHDLFVGRAPERALFAQALTASAWPFHLLHVSGPGGIGKTALLDEWAYQAQEAGVPVARVDVRELGQGSAAFERAARTALASAPAGRCVLVVDGLDAREGLEAWFCSRFLPELDARVLALTASKLPLDADWLADAAWRAEVREVHLRNLSPDESRALLAGTGVPAGRLSEALAFAHGHPLALVLIAEHAARYPDRPLAGSDMPDVIGTLLRRLVAGVPSPEHRCALEAAALVRTLDEPLLAHLMGPDAPARALFEWLRERPVVEAGPHGLFVHEAAREVLAADLHWRDPARRADLLARARRFYTPRLLAAADDAARHRTLADYAFLYRDNALVRPLLDQLRAQWDASGVRGGSPLRPTDAPALAAMTERHEGREQARIARYWIDRQPGGVEVYRDEADVPRGFVLTLELHDATPDDRAADPQCEAACAYLREHAPLRGAEQALLFRFWMDAEAHQGVSAVQSLAFAHTIRRYLTTPRLAFTFLTCRAPAFWTPVFAFADLRRLPACEVEIDGRSDGVFGHDWRATPPADWLDALVERIPQPKATAPPPPRSPTIVLSRDEFASAVREALYRYARPHKLRGSPLLRARVVSRHVAAGADEDERLSALCALVIDAARVLADSPREEPFWQALQAACFKPAPTHALAAERVGVPFSTFRRHLKRGVDFVADELWRQETAS